MSNKAGLIIGFVCLLIQIVGLILCFISDSNISKYGVAITSMIVWHNAHALYLALYDCIIIKTNFNDESESSYM